jgi:NOL1/NOP2/fmu family ribosome biogenesis protein
LCVFHLVGLQKKYFKTWQVGKDIKPKEPSEKDPIINKEAENELEEVSYLYVVTFLL